MKLFICALALTCAAATCAQAAEPVTVQQSTPYAKDAIIAGKIKRECTITTQLPHFVKVYGHADGIPVHLVPKAETGASGEVLELTIVSATSSGNAWLGHHKSTTVRGKLYRDGKKIAAFVGKRNSMGGAFGGFKGSCSVLGRTVKVLGKDIAGWLRNPTDGAQLGDLR